MRSIPIVTVAAFLVAACTTPAAFPRAHVRPTDPEAVRREAEIRRLTVERVEHARALARQSLDRASTGASQDAQRAALARAWGLASSVLADRSPGSLAAVAPSVLRVYDLGDVLADGPDAPETPLSLLPERDAPIDGGRALLERIAEQMRSADPGLWSGDTFVEPVGECLLVLQRAERFDDVERDLDRLATTRGGFARVRLAVIPANGDANEGGTWTPVDYDARVASALAAGEAPPELTVDVPYGRARGAFAGVQASYVQDFDVDAPSGLADPVIDTLRTGLVVSCTYGSPTRDGNAGLDLYVGRSSAAEPIPEFTTLIEPGAQPVTIQIPELSVQELRDRVVPTAGGSARAIRARQVFVGDPDETSPETAVWVLVHTQAHHSPADARPAWRQVEPDATQTALRAPLLEEATPLAALHLAQNDTRLATAEMRFALQHAEGHVWRRRLRISPEVAEGVLIRWPSPASDAKTKQALAESSVARAAGCGFVDVQDGLIMAYVTPESAGSVARVIGALRRGSTAARASVAFDGADESGLRCDATNQISFVQDFDVQVAEGAAIADPIIGVMAEGAVAEALPVPSAGPGTYDVRLTHAAVHDPIQEFTTSLSRGAPVTLQLPRLHIRTTWRRVVLQRGESETVESRVSTGDAEDVRRFVLRAID